MNERMNDAVQLASVLVERYFRWSSRFDDACAAVGVVRVARRPAANQRSLHCIFSGTDVSGNVLVGIFVSISSMLDFFSVHCEWPCLHGFACSFSNASRIVYGSIATA